MSPTLKSLIATLSGVILTTSAFGLDHGAIRDGGVSGGGGNVINATPPSQAVDSETAEELIRNSIPTVKFFLNNKYEQYRANKLAPPDVPLYSKIFEGSQNIFAALKTIKPDIEEHRPCFTRYGQIADASIAGFDHDSFCVSAYTIRYKVIHHEIPVQSAALMVHEYSEIVGVTEDEAVMLQEQVLNEMGNGASLR